MQTPIEYLDLRKLRPVRTIHSCLIVMARLVAAT